MTENTEQVERYFRRIVGAMVLLTGILGYFVSRYWLFATMFIGLNLIQYSFTNFCPMTKLLKKIV